MERVIKKVLNIIEKNGFEAYIIGGYVRDFILGKTSSCDIDICTNALPKDLIKLFPNSNVGIYGAIDFKIRNLAFEITTYRKEYNYKNRHPGRIEYINNLLDDVYRRDFKINSICMNQRGNIIDLLGSMDDLKKGIISAIGDPFKKMKEDPLRMLRAIRFATLLDFDIDSNLQDAIIMYNKEISHISKVRIIEELNKILISDNYVKGLDLLKGLGVLDVLGIKYNSIVKTNDVNGMWAQMFIPKDFTFNKEITNNIEIIKKIVASGEINNFILYRHGLYLTLVAGEILKVNKKWIVSMYHKLPIKCRKDIKISSYKIMKLLNISEGERLGRIINDIEENIISGKLINKEKCIKQYLLAKDEVTRDE